MPDRNGLNVGIVMDSDVVYSMASVKDGNRREIDARELVLSVFA